MRRRGERSGLDRVRFGLIGVAVGLLLALAGCGSAGVGQTGAGGGGSSGITARRVVLSWDANTEPDLAGYQVSIGTASRTYNLQTIDTGLETSLVLSDLGLDPTQLYYVAVRAYDADGNFSPYSEELSFTF